MRAERVWVGRTLTTTSTTPIVPTFVRVTLGSATGGVGHTILAGQAAVVATPGTRTVTVPGGCVARGILGAAITKPSATVVIAAPTYRAGGLYQRGALRVCGERIILV